MPRLATGNQVPTYCLGYWERRAIMPRRKDELDVLIDEELEQSFPASDPPASNAGERVGQPARKPVNPAKTKASPRDKRPAKK